MQVRGGVVTASVVGMVAGGMLGASMAAGYRHTQVAGKWKPDVLFQDAPVAGAVGAVGGGIAFGVGVNRRGFEAAEVARRSGHAAAFGLGFGACAALLALVQPKDDYAPTRSVAMFRLGAGTAGFVLPPALAIVLLNR